MNPINTVFDAKRLIGRKFSDTAVQSDIKLWPFKVISGPAEKPMIVVDFKGESKEFAAEEISSMILIKMREIAEAFPSPPCPSWLAALWPTAAWTRRCASATRCTTRTATRLDAQTHLELGVHGRKHGGSAEGGSG